MVFSVLVINEMCFAFYIVDNHFSTSNNVNGNHISIQDSSSWKHIYGTILQRVYSIGTGLYLLKNYFQVIFLLNLSIGTSLMIR